MQNVGNDYRPKFTYSDMAGDLTASPMVSMTNGRGVGWAKYVRGVRNNLRLRLAWRSMTGVLMSTTALLQEDTVGERNVCGKCRFGTKIYNRHVNHANI